MQMLTWLKPAIIGAALGAVTTALVGFNYGGWVSGRSAEQMANRQSIAAVTAALLPVCVIQSRADPEAIAKMRRLRSGHPAIRDNGAVGQASL